jgi:hypothetical protein
MSKTNPYLLGLAGFATTVLALTPGVLRSHADQARPPVAAVAFASEGAMPIREG